jgi:catechol 2,3-dioxygenase-like lactoylglutathione lyase family enzyme
MPNARFILPPPPPAPLLPRPLRFPQYGPGAARKGRRGEVSRPKVKLDHCVIHVSDWERSNAFYRDVLGAEVIHHSGPAAVYRFGDVQLNVHGPGLAPAPVARLPVPPGGSDLCFEWPGPIDGAVGHLERHGVAVELGPVRRYGALGAGVSVYFRDPDGSLLEFIAYPGEG